MAEIRKGDIGTTISLDTGISIAASESQEIHYRKPSGTKGSWDAEKGSGNIIYYVTKEDDIDEHGTWILQSFVKFNNGEWRGEKVEMEVGNILAEKSMP